MTNGFETIFIARKKLCLDKVDEFYEQKSSEYLLRERKTKVYPLLYNDLKNVSLERFNKTLLHISNEPMFINGDCNWIKSLSYDILPKK